MVNRNTASPEINSHLPNIVICGTDTDIGKTIISCLLVQGLNAIYWKPIQSGLEDGGDRSKICQILQLTEKRWLPEIYKFKAAVSPHWAAEKENIEIDPINLQLPVEKRQLIIETAGGLLVPLNRHFLQIDLLQQWMLPIVLVARSGLGTLNHTLLSIEALKNRGIPILGIILNGPYHQDNPKTLYEISDVPIIAELPNLKELSSKTLAEQWSKQGLTAKFKTLLNNYK